MVLIVALQEKLQEIFSGGEKLWRWHPEDMKKDKVPSRVGSQISWLVVVNGLKQGIQIRPVQIVEHPRVETGKEVSQAERQGATIPTRSRNEVPRQVIESGFARSESPGIRPRPPPTGG